MKPWRRPICPLQPRALIQISRHDLYVVASRLTPAWKTGLLAHNVFMNATKPTLDDLRIARSAGSEPKSRAWLGAVLVLVLLLVPGVIWWRAKSSTIEVRTALARDAVAGTGSERVVLNASGYVTARRQATVSAKVMARLSKSWSRRA